MIQIKTTTKDDIEDLMNVRLEMLRIVNNMSNSDTFNSTVVEQSRNYFINGNQTTVIAIDENEIVGCATISYINILPTFDHPTGKRAYLMNVYTNKNYRRQGIAKQMLAQLIAEAKNKGVTEISLDATESGRPLYKSLGFKENKEAMVLEMKR